MACHGRTVFSSLAISALALAVICAASSPAQAGEPRKKGKPDSAAFTQASFKGYYAYGSLAETQAGYGMLKLDGLGNLSTDDITLNLPGASGRVIKPLGPGRGEYTVEPNGVGKFNIEFYTLDPPIEYEYEFVVKQAVPEGEKHAPHATEIFTSSDITGVANASVTFISALKKKTNQPVAKFNLASLEGRYAYTNNADYYASYGVLVFDGKGNVHSDGKLNVNGPDRDDPDRRKINRFGPGSGTYTLDPTGRGHFKMYFDDLHGEYTWNFVVTRISDEARGSAALATGLFSTVDSGGSSGQFVAPVLTRIFPD